MFAFSLKDYFASGDEWRDPVNKEKWPGAPAVARREAWRRKSLQPGGVMAAELQDC